MNKSFESQTDENELSKEDLALINTFTQKEMAKDDIFSFCVILCDNEIDRDYERFTEDSLHKLADFFIGKTAIRDHSMKSSDQSARTYKTEVIKDSTRKNSLGEDYVYLKAWCYMPRIKKNEELIEEIKAGIIKEGVPVVIGRAKGSVKRVFTMKAASAPFAEKSSARVNAHTSEAAFTTAGSVTVSCKIPRTHTSGRLSPYLHRKTRV